MKICIVCFVFLCFYAASNAQPSSQAAREALDARLAAVNISDFFFLLGNEDGVFYTYQKGSLTNTTSVPVASSSKWVSSIVFNTLIKDGTLSFLDQPQDYIDWWTSDTSDKRARIRVQHLLNFQSGYGETNTCVFQATMNMEDCVKLIYNSSTLIEPGTAFIYSENHMHILGLMAQKKTGKTFNQLFTDIIKTPLELTASKYPGPNARPSSSLSTNVIEYEKILRSIYLKTILPADVIDMMEQDQTNVSITLSPADEYDVAWHYALGHWVECPYDKWNPSCLTDIYRRSSPGALGFYPWIDRKMNYYGILATVQSKGGATAQMVDSMRDEIHAVLAAVTVTPGTQPLTSSSPSSVNSPSDNSQTPTKGMTSGSTGIIATTWISLVIVFLSLF